MRLTELAKKLDQHDILIKVTEARRLRLVGDKNPPPSVVGDATRALMWHKLTLLTALAPQSGVTLTVSLSSMMGELPKMCSTCHHWQPSPDWPAPLGICTAPDHLFAQHAPRALAIHIAHPCTTRGGKGWQPLESEIKQEVMPSLRESVKRVAQ